MSKTDDVARRFHEWMERYDHRDETPAESFKSFLVADRCVADYGVSYEEYKDVAEKINDLGHRVARPVPKDAFDFLVEESRRRIPER